MSEMKLYSDSGERLYLTSSERERFELEAKLQDRETMTLAQVLLYTGCRLSEAINLKMKHIDVKNNSIRIEFLKKRKEGVFRSIPVPVFKGFAFLVLNNTISDTASKCKD